MSNWFTIGKLAKASGCKVQTIRYYEEIHLLPEAVRSAGNQRLYRSSDLNRLKFIRHSRELGFALDEIRELLHLADDPDQPCAVADAIARSHLQAVQRRISQLQALEFELQRMVAHCAGGRVGECRVIEVLADHNHCLTEEH